MAKPGEADDRDSPSVLASTATLTLVLRSVLDDRAVGDLRDEILRAVDRGVLAITVDLSEAPRLPIEGLHVLALAGEMMRNRGAALVVVARDADGQSLVACGPDVGARLAAALQA